MNTFKQARRLDYFCRILVATVCLAFHLPMMAVIVYGFLTVISDPMEFYPIAWRGVIIFVALSSACCLAALLFLGVVLRWRGKLLGWCAAGIGIAWLIFVVETG